MKSYYNHRMKLSLLCLCFCLITKLSLGVEVNNITANRPLTADQTLVSSRKVFELGFFPSPGNTSNYYIGIWYKKISSQTVVWVANKESPIFDKNSAQLKILEGNLVLTNGSKSNSAIWSTNVTTTSGSVQALLEDSGNLVLKSGPNFSQILWQSFDHPCDTWLPGGKIAYYKNNQTKQLLTSWKNTADPAPGLFTLELNAKTKEYIIMWNRTQPYWTSGPWNEKEKIFSLVPEMRLNYIYDFKYVDNENVSYFTYSVKDDNVISRFVMHTSGQVKQLTWLENTQQWNLFWSQPRQQCQVYAYCGKFGSCNQNSMPFCNCMQGFKPVSNNDWGLSDYSRGCVRNTPLQCESSGSSNKEKDRFWVYPNMGLLQNGQSLDRVSSLEECQSGCLKNCSCTAYAYDGSGCSVWFGDLLNLQQLSDDGTSGRTLYVRLAASDFPNSSHTASDFPNSSHTKMVVGTIVGSVGGVLVILGLVLVICCWRRRRYSVRSTKGVEGSLIPFGYRELQAATKNFSNKLGGGGFGSVFKGTLPDSSVIAVKKLEGFSQGEKQFRTEVSTIGTVQHVNLVRLRGFCSEGAKKLLVYDFMPNGSLDVHLFHDKGTLDWQTRYQISLGTARGLAYLHEKCRDCIIHCDIKPENILLDADFCPKVADFGLAKLVGRDFSRVLTTMRGTRGYLAPEWLSGVPITAKADVFSYGMMLFEMLSGRRNTEQSADGIVTFYPTWVASKLLEGEDMMSALDSRLEGNVDSEQVMKICKLACWCIQDDENHRPSMGQIVLILEGVLDVNTPPTPRSLQVFADNQKNIMFFTESSSSGTSSQARYTSSVVSSQTKSSPSVTST